MKKSIFTSLTVMSSLFTMSKASMKQLRKPSTVVMPSTRENININPPFHSFIL